MRVFDDVHDTRRTHTRAGATWQRRVVCDSARMQFHSGPVSLKCKISPLFSLLFREFSPQIPCRFPPSLSPPKKNIYDLPNSNSLAPTRHRLRDYRPARSCAGSAEAVKRSTCATRCHIILFQGCACIMLQSAARPARFVQRGASGPRTRRVARPPLCCNSHDGARSRCALVTQQRCATWPQRALCEPRRATQRRRWHSQSFRKHACSEEPSSVPPAACRLWSASPPSRSASPPPAASTLSPQPSLPWRCCRVFFQWCC